MNAHRLILTTLMLVYLGMVNTLVYGATKEEEMNKYLKEAQTSKDVKTRVNAIKEIGDIGALSAKLGKPAIPVLLKLLDDKEPRIRGAAAANIGRLSLSEPQDVVDKLVTMLKEDKNVDVRESAARGLGSIGPDAKEAVPALREAMKKATAKKDSMVYQGAIQSITGKKK